MDYDNFEKKQKKISEFLNEKKIFIREMFRSSDEVLCDYSIIKVNYWMQVDHTTQYEFQSVKYG